MKTRLSIFLIILALIAGMVSCGGGGVEYDLAISSTAGGSVTAPGEGTFTYDEGTVVDLVAQPDEGYQFINWTGDVGGIADVYAAETTITINNHCSITANFALEIRNWYDLDAIRDNLGGNYLLMNDLDSATAGYTELASEIANEGKGWQPIGDMLAKPIDIETFGSDNPFAGILDGRGYEISGLFVNRPDEHGVGLFGFVGEGGVVENLGVVNAEITGYNYVGGLVGYSWGAVCRSYSIGSVTGERSVGGLVGKNHDGTVSNSYYSGSVVGECDVAGLVGVSEGTVNDSYFAGSVTGGSNVGGLVASGSWGVVCNSHYDYDQVLINGNKIITTGALFHEDFEQWLTDDRFLDVNERLSEENGYYVIDNVTDFKQVLAFGQDGSLKFRLRNDLDLSNEANFYIPYLAGEFDGDGYKIWNLSLSLGSVSDIGLFGLLASGGKVTRLGVENVDITGVSRIGGLVGNMWDSTISNAYSSGSISGDGGVGGLVGRNHGTLRDSYFIGSVTGDSCVSGLVGWNTGTVSNAYYSYNEVLINGQNVITVGALFREDFEQWIANDKSLDVNERLAEEDGYYVIDDISDFKQLLAFGQDDSLKFKLNNDLDLVAEPGFYIPYLAGDFDGNGRKITNLSFRFDFIEPVGLFGFLACGGKITRLGVENVDITGANFIGGLVGDICGTVSQSYSTGSVAGDSFVGGLVGNIMVGTVSNSYSTSSVTGEWCAGGLVGENYGTVSNSYSTGSVTGSSCVGGLAGENYGGVSNSFWDTQTSGQSTSAGGTGRTTAEMKSIATFSGAAWDIIAVANPGTRNPSYIWNIVDGETYPLLSWQSVS